MPDSRTIQYRKRLVEARREINAEFPALSLKERKHLTIKRAKALYRAFRKQVGKEYRDLMPSSPETAETR